MNLVTNEPITSPIWSYLFTHCLDFRKDIYFLFLTAVNTDKNIIIPILILTIIKTTTIILTALEKNKTSK